MSDLRFGFPECLLIFSAVISFHDLKISLSLAFLSCIFSFFKFALEINEKKERKEKIDSTTQVLNEQIQGLGKIMTNSLENLSKNSKVNEENNILLNRGKFGSTIQ